MGLLPTVLDTKCDNILAQERRLAKGVAKAVIGEQQVTVWDVLIPLIFAVNLFRYLRARETFALNFLFTKKLALETAKEMVKRGLDKEKALAKARRRTAEILAADRRGVYSQKIRQKQLREIDLLVDHYLKLIHADGKDYDSMVRNAYGTRESFEAFLRELQGAERAVNMAARQTVGGAQALEIIAKMEEAAERLRQQLTDRIFGPA